MVINAIKLIIKEWIGLLLNYIVLLSKGSDCY